MTRKHTVDEVVRTLSKKKDCKIDVKLKVIEILSKNQSNDLGNGSWGKIDFLVNHNGWTKVFVEDFSRS